MHYLSYSLNGSYEMAYSDRAYLGTQEPGADLYETALDMPDSRFDVISDAIPGYWEDMTDKFATAQFYRTLRVNPEYGLWRYPITEYSPDMSLPNIVGNFLYRRSFEWSGKEFPTELYFGGVQNAVSVWINGKYLGRHEGYSAPFTVEIPKGTVVEGNNTILFSVSNTPITGYGGEIVSGITNRAACECTGGIYSDVELRIYPTTLRDVGIFVAKDGKSVTVKPEMTAPASLEWRVTDGARVLLCGKTDTDFTFSTKSLECWSPENPKLYTLSIGVGEYMLERRFGVRSLVTEGSSFRLNGKPYYMRGVCEHCYYPDTVNPWQDKEKYRAAIKKLKELGFNFIRTHSHVPNEQYLSAADELGMIVHVESPNNTSLSEWKEIVRFARRHPSALIYCCGNEMMLDEPFIEHLSKCADVVHKDTDALFSPVSAMRGVEYRVVGEDAQREAVKTPFEHHPHRFAEVGKFADMYSSYALGHLSYNSTKGDPDFLDSQDVIYRKPRCSHEICIHSTYVDLSLKDRYKNSRIGMSGMLESIEKHLADVGLLERAPLYFARSVEWQRRLRKHCFETARRAKTLAGYDFLGPIDTHWHTFGYDCGMMNEFYELKPGETVRNVRMYNSPTVLLTDLGTRSNFYAGDKLDFTLSVSHFGSDDLADADLCIRLSCGGKTILRKSASVNAPNGKVSEIYHFSECLPDYAEPKSLKLYVTLDGGDTFAENEWEIYVFPRVEVTDFGNILVSDGMTEEELVSALKAGQDVLLLGGEPFNTRPTYFRMALAGRANGNFATVVADHPLINKIPHEGFCSWQFAPMIDNGSSVVFASRDIPFDPMVEIVWSHKNAVRQAAVFEYRVMSGRLLVCTLDLSKDEPASHYLRAAIVSYMQGREFSPKNTLDQDQLHSLISTKVKTAGANVNLAFNVNDKTTKRCK